MRKSLPPREGPSPIRVVDTNVPLTANRAVAPREIPEELILCVEACVKAIRQVIDSRGLVLDEGGEIFEEYRHDLSLSGQPGVGDAFLKWVHDNQWDLPEAQRVRITPKGESYEEFPDHPGLADFDPSDRKFVAAANAHPDRPPILQATDSKWWGWSEALEACGLSVVFLCPEYVREKYAKKIGP